MGAGAFGTVYKATRLCALKVIDISTVRDHERAAQKREWKQEVDALMKVCGHENVVEYRNSFASVDNKLWLEMEFCNGGTLNDYVIQKKPGRDIKHRFMLEMSSGVAFLHANCVVHRDLKPENIMISLDEENQPHIKVGDFGLAKVLASCNNQGQMLQYYLTSGCGTEYFMAPEVYDGHYTEKADIFSMGVIMFALVAGPISKTFDKKKYLVFYDGNHGIIGKHIQEKKQGLTYCRKYDHQVGQTVLKLLDSTIYQKYNERPSAKEVNTKLKSISPKELLLLAPSPAASP